MKRSNLFLVLAISLPLGLSMIGLTISTPTENNTSPVSVNDVKNQQPDWSDEDARNSKVVISETVKIQDALVVQADVSNLNITFDARLTLEAKVQVLSRETEGIEASFQENRFDFRPAKDHRNGIKVDLVLPAKMTAIELILNASKCHIGRGGAVAIKSFKLSINASSCEFDFDNLIVDDTTIDLNAGNLILNADTLTLQNGIESVVNAGKFSMHLQDIKFLKSELGNQSLKFTNAMGRTEIDIGGMPEHSVHAKTSMGQLTLKRRGKSEHQFGFNDEWQIGGPDGAPRILIDVSMGKVDIDLP